VNDRDRLPCAIVLRKTVALSLGLTLLVASCESASRTERNGGGPPARNALHIVDACGAITRAVAGRAIGVALPANNPGVPNDRDGCEYDSSSDESEFVSVDRVGPGLRARTAADLAGQNQGAERMDSLANGGIGYLTCSVVQGQHSCQSDLLVADDEFVITAAGRSLASSVLKAAVTSLSTALCESATAR